MGRKTYLIGAVVAAVVALDVISKRWALEALEPGRTIHFGWVPITLAFNKGAAFSMNVGPASRWFFLGFSIVALAALIKFYLDTPWQDRVRLFALATIVAGALGNLYDRIRWDRGVVDFIGPVDLGFYDFPIFNIADSAITCGAILLLISLWAEKPSREAPAETVTAGE